MDLLKRELERKKKAMALLKEKAMGEIQKGEGRIFLKAGDLRRLQEEQEENLAQQKRKKYETRQDEGVQIKKRKEEPVSVKPKLYQPR
jgi:hypothetical protein